MNNNPELSYNTASSNLTHTFPFVSIPAKNGSSPIEVCLIACLTPGSGNKLFYEVLARQKSHDKYVDELDEPSAKIGSTDFDKGDSTALYTFGVGHKGHPFHRHAGHRVFSAISGSGGTQLRFSTATLEDIAQDPLNFIKALHLINIPPDCLFTVRFSGENWHQFMPLISKSTHPAFFALSCHTNELGGNLSEDLYKKVKNNDADIPSLTELLPESVIELLERTSLNSSHISTTSLFLDNKPGGLMNILCKELRSILGKLCGISSNFKNSHGFIIKNDFNTNVIGHHLLPNHSLLNTQLINKQINHEDYFTVTISVKDLKNYNANATLILSKVLDGFIKNQPAGITYLMKLRNFIVTPLKLRTSELGCPVSSLLSDKSCDLFVGKHPVISQQISSDNKLAQVILGADDRHLSFRSCAAVQILPNETIEFSLSTRVACQNNFGIFYMAMISKIHRSYVAPTMLKNAVKFLIDDYKKIKD
jgi:hypothetical protein